MPRKNTNKKLVKKIDEEDKYDDNDTGVFVNRYICMYCGKQGTDDPDCSHCGEEMCVMLKQVFVKSYK